VHMPVCDVHKLGALTQHVSIHQGSSLWVAQLSLPSTGLVPMRIRCVYRLCVCVCAIDGECNACKFIE